MSNATLTQRVQPSPPAVPSAKRLAAIALAVWFALAFVLGARGALVTPPGTPPLPILIAATVPLLAFFAGLWMSRSLRELLLAADLRFLMAIQAWRFAGLSFVALYVHGVLPGAFAWPAGLGDIAIGVSAPWLLLALIRRPAFAASRTFVVWNALGILDLVVAVGTGVLSSGRAGGAASEITSGAMAQLPLALIPTFFVPIFVMLHVAALVQARHLARDLARTASA